MTRPSIAAAAAALTLALGACAPSTHATAFRQVAPKASAEQVEVFTDAKPDHPYEEIGTIEVSASELSNSRYGDLIQRARQRAAEMGADAIIVTRNPQSHTNVAAYVPAQKGSHGRVVSGSAHTIETPRVEVAAIAWKATSRN